MTLLSATKEFFPKITPGKIMVFSPIKLFSPIIIGLPKFGEFL